MKNLHYEIRICKKIYNRVTMIRNVYNEISDSSIYKKLLKCDVFKKILAPFVMLSQVNTQQWESLKFHNNVSVSNLL